MTHELKCWPKYFKEILAGHKNFEIRYNDRNFKVGDFLILEEFEPSTQVFTDRRIACLVTYVLHSIEYEGLTNGYVALGIQL